ncbi:MAG: C39 family peptidase [Acutalibacter sp.]
MIFLWLLCLFAAVVLLVLLIVSPAAGMLLSSGEGDGQSQLQQERGILDAPFIDQRDQYPTGCESVTAVMALQYEGVDVTVEEFIDDYLPQGDAPYQDHDGDLVGDSPWEVFLGSPYEDSGWGCYAPVIGKAVEHLLEDRHSPLEVEELTGVSLDRLCEDYIDRGTPVMLWATIDMEEPTPSTQYILQNTGESFTWMYPLHCLLLTGETEDSYVFNDPLVGKNVTYSKDAVERAYKGIGMQAVVVEDPS